MHTHIHIQYLLVMACFEASSRYCYPSLALFKIREPSSMYTKLVISIPSRNSSVKRNGLRTMASTLAQKPLSGNYGGRKARAVDVSSPSSEVVEELFAVMELVADRAEMHKNIGVQRDNWNRLLLSSVNGMTVTAATMTGLAASVSFIVSPQINVAPVFALKLGSTMLYLAATGFLMVMNKIQPSQLAEEQRNAARLFKQLREEVNSNLSLKEPTMNDVNGIMEKVLALDKAYPLPLIGTMLDKFPKYVEPAVWWPKTSSVSDLKQVVYRDDSKISDNGWTEDLEEELREIVSVLKKKDAADYMRLSKLVLKLNKLLAICGPLFTFFAAIGSLFVGSSTSSSSTWGVTMGVVFGVLATIVNTVEHGGQVRMVFEMYRSSAGFFTLMEENIDSTLNGKVERRENGKVFEAEVALKLGRSISELRDLARKSHSRTSEAKEEFASKLF